MKLVARVLHVGLTAVFALMLVACQSTVTGTPVLAPEEIGPDGAVIARMNTGLYSTVPSRPYGTAGTDLMLQATLEGHRLGAVTVGPWTINTALNEQPPAMNLWTGPMSGVEELRTSGLLPDQMVDAVAAHGFFSGFYSVRLADNGVATSLHNMVLEFDDAAGAAAAATEMAAVNVPVAGQPGVPVPVAYHPEVSALSFAHPDGSTTMQGVVARGRFVLLSSAHTAATTAGPLAPGLLIQDLVDRQEGALEGFSPTEPAKRAALPMDPTGALMAKTLRAPDNTGPFIIGVWDPQGWLHFEDDPVSAAALFASAGVETVAQRLATVYQTQSSDGAGKIVDQFAKDMKTTTDVQPAAGVPGLPEAKCFVRSRGYESPSSAISWQRVYWRYKCVARADRFAFTAFSFDDGDVHQQMAAQYRLLVGK